MIKKQKKSSITQLLNYSITDGFTFIEMLVTIAIIGLVLPVLFAIIFTILQQQTKIYRLSEVKRQGDYVLNVMENVIKIYATKIYSESIFINEKCSTANSSYGPQNGNTFYFRDKSDRWFNFYLNNNKITSHSANLFSPLDLTNTKVQVLNFNIQCDRTATYSPPIVSISFNIQYNTTSTRPEETASLTYQTKIKLKSY